MSRFVLREKQTLNTSKIIIEATRPGHPVALSASLLFADVTYAAVLRMVHKAFTLMLGEKESLMKICFKY